MLKPLLFWEETMISQFSRIRPPTGSVMRTMALPEPEIPSADADSIHVIVYL